jgi:hypothetical protein
LQCFVWTASWFFFLFFTHSKSTHAAHIAKNAPLLTPIPRARPVPKPLESCSLAAPAAIGCESHIPGGVNSTERMKASTVTNGCFI